MKKHGFIKILTEDQCKIASNSIDKLYDLWIQRERPERDFYTIGGVSYREGVDDPLEYLRHSKFINPILKDNFGWIYDIILSKLSKEIGPCELIDPLSYPGFHVIGHPPGKLNTMWNRTIHQAAVFNIHIDTPHCNEEHRKVWSQFKNSQHKTALSWTLLIESPKYGAALATWDDEELKQYEKPNDPLVEYIKNCPDYEDFRDYKPPTAVVSYKLGELFFFSGFTTHQIGPSYKLDEHDRRITMQGHCVMCDGIWRVYF